MTKLSLDAIKLLYQACFMEEEYFMCFGKFYNQLKKNNLIDDECRPTFYGRKFIKFCVDEDVFDEQPESK